MSEWSKCNIPNLKKNLLKLSRKCHHLQWASTLVTFHDFKESCNLRVRPLTWVIFLKILKKLFCL